MLNIENPLVDGEAFRDPRERCQPEPELLVELLTRPGRSVAIAVHGLHGGPNPRRDYWQVDKYGHEFRT